MQTLFNMAFHIIQFTIVACDMASSTLSQSFGFLHTMAEQFGSSWNHTNESL